MPIYVVKSLGGEDIIWTLQNIYIDMGLTSLLRISIDTYLSEICSLAIYNFVTYWYV